MADSPAPSAITEANPPLAEPENHDPSMHSSSIPSSSAPLNPNPTPPSAVPSLSPLRHPVNPYAVPPQVSVPPFRLGTPPVPIPSAPQFSPLPVPNYSAYSVPNPGVQPPGVSQVAVVVPGSAGGAGAGAVAISAPLMMSPYAPPGQSFNPLLRPYTSLPNGYPTIPMPAAQGSIPPPGILRYRPPYMPMVTTPFPPRPPVLPLSRPPVPMIRGPIMPPIVRPAMLPNVTPTEKPQTTVYVGHLASTVDNDFILSLLQLCGPVKNWKRAQDPSNGSLKGYGFCEFESAEGVLRSLRLLSKLNVDGQELLINVAQATREYLERYVEKKTENLKKSKETETEAAEIEEGKTPGAEKSESPKASAELKKDENDAGNEESNDAAIFGIVTDEDREADLEALENLTSIMDERLKNKPLPPPPPPPQTAADGLGNSNSEPPARSRDGESDAEVTRDAEETTSEGKHTSEHGRPETSSPDGTRRHDGRSRGRDRDRESTREREVELERKERAREQERAWREKERDLKMREGERRYNARVADWDDKQKEKEYFRQRDKDKERDRERKRKRLIEDQERESDDGDSRRRRHKYSSEERKRRLREKEDDLADRLKEEEEAARAKRRAEEELQQQKERKKEALELLPSHLANGTDKGVLPGENMDGKDKVIEEANEGDSQLGNHSGGGLQYGTGDELVMGSTTALDTRQNSGAPAKKLGFGLVGSGKRTAVLSVFDEEEDEESRQDKKMRPLVPIDYSTEEQQVVQSTISSAPSPNLAAAAELAKRLENSPKEEKSNVYRGRSRRYHDRPSHRDRDRNEQLTNHTKEAFERDGDREHGLDKVRTPDTKKLLDAKQLIDMIPKTKDELFSYEVNWAVYDKNKLHDRMRPWISKKITEFLGEEETTLVDYIVNSMQEHVKASEMLERLQAILDEEAEMFVLKMWRMLIFEIKRIETGLALRSKA